MLQTNSEWSWDLPAIYWNKSLAIQVKTSQVMQMKDVDQVV